MDRALPRKPLIAIVEDDPAVRHSLAFDLEAQGYAICAFDSALKALECARLADIDCLVIDYGLPDVHGAALLGRLRVRGVRCPAVFIASNPTQRCLKDVSATGSPLIEKPLLGGALGDQIRALL